MKFLHNVPHLYSIEEVVSSTTVTSIAPLHVKQPAFVRAADVQSSLGWFTTYRPLLLILAYLVTASVLVQLPKNGWEGVHWYETVRYFMAGFFLIFSFFKLLDISAFADAYAGYDLLAKRWRSWGLIYPFVELALGLAHLSNLNPLFTNWVTLIVMGCSAIGVMQTVLRQQSIRYAYLGTVFKLPMSTVTIIEDIGMAIMATAMLLFI